MKIEKLNDNQIRCILEKKDLEERNLQLSELAYGSVKAKELFRDMMEQAAMEFGFDAENIPLMIEAIPVSKECLILVVTKVEDPEELDTRFSRFSNMLEEGLEHVAEHFDEILEELPEEIVEKLANLPNLDELPFGDTDDLPFDGPGTSTDGEASQDMNSVDMNSDNMDSVEGNNKINGKSSNMDANTNTDDVVHFHTNDDSDTNKDKDGMGILEPFTQALSKAKEELLRRRQAKEMPRAMDDQVYAFESLDQVIHLSSYLVPFYQGDSVLYKDEVQEVYYLLLLRDGTDENLYKRACTICTDHGEFIPTSYASTAYFDEHFKMVCEQNAIRILNQFN